MLRMNGNQKKLILCKYVYDMRIEEILSLESLSDQLSLLRQNCNQMKPNDIIRSIKFYENDHKIKRDKERQDMYVIEKALASDGKTTID